MQETIHQKNQLEANVIENDSLKKQLEGKQQLLSLANKEAEELQQRCTDFKLEIAILREQLQARTRNEEKLQSEIDASRDDLAVERRSDSLRLHCYDYQQLVPLQQAAAARARPRRAQGVHSPPEAILPPCPACSRPAPLISHLSAQEPRDDAGAHGRRRHGGAPRGEHAAAGARPAGHLRPLRPRPSRRRRRGQGAWGDVDGGRRGLENVEEGGELREDDLQCIILYYIILYYIMLYYIKKTNCRVLYYII